MHDCMPREWQVQRQQAQEPVCHRVTEVESTGQRVCLPWDPMVWAWVVKRVDHIAARDHEREAAELAGTASNCFDGPANTGRHQPHAHMLCMQRAGAPLRPRLLNQETSLLGAVAATARAVGWVHFLIMRPKWSAHGACSVASTPATATRLRAGKQAGGQGRAGRWQPPAGAPHKASTHLL